MTSSPVKLSSVVPPTGDETNLVEQQHTIPSSPINIYTVNPIPTSQIDDENFHSLKSYKKVLTTLEQTDLSTLLSGSQIRETYIWGTRVNASETFLAFRRFLLEFKRPFQTSDTNKEEEGEEEPYYLTVLKQVIRV
jgi:hypothetical protein